MNIKADKKNENCNKPSKKTARGPGAMKLCMVMISTTLLFTKHLHSAAADFKSPFVSVTDFAATGNDLSDDSLAFTNAINWCKSNGYKTLFVPNGTYYIQSALPPLNDNGFKVVNIVGESSYTTIIDGSSLSSGSAILKTSGGSGQITHAEICDLAIRGGGGETGIQIKGTCGVRIRNCRFLSLGIGVEFSNDMGVGAFTEYSVADGCEFDAGCQTAVKFTRGTGDASFHGSGLKGCIISNASTNSYPAIVVGNAGENINLYNSPLDFQIWTTTSLNVISVNSSGSRVMTYGTITLENNGGATHTPFLVGGAGGIVHAGSVLSNGECHFGNLKLDNAVKLNSDGSNNQNARPYNAQRTLTVPATTIDEVSCFELGSIVSVMLTGTNYDYRFLLLVSHNGYGSAGYVKVLNEDIVITGTAPSQVITKVEGLKVYDPANIGGPVFSVATTGKLVVTNPNYAGQSILAKFAVTPLGMKKESFWY